VNIKRYKGISRLGFILFGAWACGGCAYAVTTSAGVTVEQSARNPDPLSSALRMSASRDLGCEASGLSLERLDAERQYAVTGCGRRALYRAVTPTPTTKRLELVSSSAAAPGHDVALLSPVTH
jgi:hypothetical protein